MSRSVVAWLFLALPAMAAPSRTWVTADGDDINVCSRRAPCRTLAVAVERTPAGGEVDVADTTSLGELVITKSITINAHLTRAGIFSADGNGIVVQAGPNDVVVLRGLEIQGARTGLTGIKFVSGKLLKIEDCRISGFAVAGISLVAAEESDARLQLENTTVTRNGAEGSNISLTSGVTVMNRVNVLDGTIGITTANDAKLTLSNSLVSGHLSAGINAGDGSEVSIKHTVISGNGGAIHGASTVRLTDSMISHNTAALPNVLPPIPLFL